MLEVISATDGVALGRGWAFWVVDVSVCPSAAEVATMASMAIASWSSVACADQRAAGHALAACVWRKASSPLGKHLGVLAQGSAVAS